jgi:hypothetical protein
MPELLRNRVKGSASTMKRATSPEIIRSTVPAGDLFLCTSRAAIYKAKNALRPDVFNTIFCSLLHTLRSTACEHAVYKTESL